MNLSLASLVLGLLGLIVMALSGVAHTHHASGHHPPGHHPPASGPPGHGHHGPAHHAHGKAGSILLTLMSPRVLFSVMIGAGLTGLLLEGEPLPGAFRDVVALIGGVLFERFVVQPYWNALMTFQSRPARSLGSVAMTHAQAMTDFDQVGQGLVALEFEGEVRQLLATQVTYEHAAGLRIKRGDLLQLDTVDEAHNRCTVSTLNPAVFSRRTS